MSKTYEVTIYLTIARTYHVPEDVVPDPQAAENLCIEGKAEHLMVQETGPDFTDAITTELLED